VTPFLGTGAISEPNLGKWKDSLFDCAKFGFFHTSFLNSICCPQILMAQVLTRLKMNWVGEENVPDHEWRRCFRRILVLVCLYWPISLLLAPPTPLFLSDPSTGNVVVAPPQSSQTPLNGFLYKLVSWTFGIYTILLLTRLRRAVRRKYEIPLRYPSLGVAAHLEDVCLSFWCGCCTVAQVARQTCDYERQTAACCSSTGLGSQTHYPILVV
jgi:Cys-rich protein (TIGR01571 family)